MSKKPLQITTLHMTILNVEVAFDWDISAFHVIARPSLTVHVSKMRKIK